jgi:hypothetical protein
MGMEGEEWEAIRTCELAVQTWCDWQSDSIQCQYGALETRLCARHERERSSNATCLTMG